MDKVYKKELKGFIDEQLKKGYFEEEIINHLVAHGHDENDIKKILQEEDLEEEEEIFSHTKLITIAVIIIILGFLIIMTGLSTKAPGTAILLGFLPSVLTLIYTAISLENKKLVRHVWSMPLIITLIFFVLEFVGKGEVLSGMDAIKIAVLNLVLSYAIVFAIQATIKEEKRAEDIEAEPEEGKPSKKTEIKKEIGAIEDKLKALNFVIGRVYQTRNGATKEMREKINFPPDLYNELQEAFKERDDNIVKECVKKISDRLNSLESSETSMFGRVRLVNLDRDTHGSDKIIDVLAKNDKDPVMSYYEEAKRIADELKGSF